MEPRYVNEKYEPYERRTEVEKIKLMVTETQAKRINNLVKRIRLTREEWCETVNDELKKINTYKNKTDASIIIEALQHYLWEEEEELETMYEHMEEKNDKTD